MISQYSCYVFVWFSRVFFLTSRIIKFQCSNFFFFFFFFMEPTSIISKHFDRCDYIRNHLIKIRMGNLYSDVTNHIIMIVYIYGKCRCIPKWFKNALIFIFLFFIFLFFFFSFFFLFIFFFFRFEGKLVKLKIIKLFCLFIRTAFAANWMDVTCQSCVNFWDKKWQKIILGIKLSWNFFFH